ncbi:MAG: histidine kinase, partial [Verrucomicrobiales bacterium]
MPTRAPGHLLRAAFPLLAALFASGAPSLATPSSNIGPRTQIREIEAQLEGLPTRTRGPSGGTFGYGSSSSLDPHPSPPKWVQVDLGAIYDIDEIFLVPAILIRGDKTETTYGFPLRFRVETATDDTFSDASTVFDADDGAFPDPGRSPILLPGINKAARYVRVTASELSSSLAGDRAFFGLGELFVFSGEQNVALGKTVGSLDRLASSRFWKPEFLVDGFTALGQPRLRQSGGSSGYHSQTHERENTEVWVQIDLGASRVVNEIRMLPAHPRPNFASIHSYGYGFPSQFRIELSHDPEMDDASVLYQRTAGLFPNPGDNVVCLPVDDRAGRYLRLTATRLFTGAEEPGHFLALAELQVLSAGDNVALNRSVSASDSIERGGWSCAALVDGLSRGSRILPLRGWLEGLALRRELTTELGELEIALAARLEQRAERLQWAAAAALAALVALGILLVRNRRQRHRQIEAMRDQIASDLHDEIGSNLGSIALFSEGLANRAGLPGEDGEMLEDISRVARESSQTIRDMVWVLGEHTGAEKDLILRMRQTSARMLQGIDYSFDVSSHDLTAKVPL